VLGIDIKKQLVIRMEPLDCLAAIDTKPQNGIGAVCVIINQLISYLG